MKATRSTFGRIFCLQLLPVWAGLLVLLCYLPGLKSDFQVIDDATLVAIPQIRAAFDLELLKTWLTPGGHVDFYPFRDFSYWLDVHFFGASARGEDGTIFRLQNFAWVVTAAVFIRLILRRARVPDPAASVVASLWMLHPVHSELLMWIAARKDGMAMGLGLMAVYFFLRQQTEGRLRWGVAALAAFLLSLLSKSSLALLPGCVPLVAWRVPETRKGLCSRGSVAVWGSALITGIAVSIIQSRFYSTVNDMRFFYSWGYRVSGVLAAFGRMWAGWFLPRYNAIDVENWGEWVRLHSGFIPVGLLALLALLAVTAMVLRRREALGVASIGAFWASYIPISALFFPHRNFYSVRYLEVPAICMIFAAVSLFRSGSSGHQRSRFISGVVAVLLAIALLGGTIREGRLWEDEAGPFEKALALSPSNPSNQRMLYDTLMNQERWGRLTAGAHVTLERLGRELSDHCSRPVAVADLRNGHLCLGLWAGRDESHRGIRLPPDHGMLAVRALESVNPQSAERLMSKWGVTQAVDGGLSSDRSSFLGLLRSFGGREGAADTRFERWASLCLLGQTGEARALFEDWSRRHLMDRIEMDPWISDLGGRLRGFLTLARECRAPGAQAKKSPGFPPLLLVRKPGP